MAVKAKASLTVTDLTDVLRVTPFWRARPSTAATPAKPTTTSTSAAVSDWSKTMPAYDSSKRCYTCTRSERGDGSCYWSDVTEDQGWRGANAANSAATNASQTAKDAQAAASAAQSTADSAKSTAQAAASDAATAKTDASSAVSTANSANTKSESAVSTANSAASTASTAKSTADAAKTSASTAVSTANAASSTAGTAKSTADAAQAKADDAWARTLRVEVMSAPADAAGDTSLLTAYAFRGGELLSDEAVAKMGLLAWYVGGKRVATGNTYTCKAGTAAECRLEA